MSNRTVEKITVYDVLQTASEDGEWVNGEFEAIVSNPTQGQGRKPSKCRLSDPDNHGTSCTGVWFGGDFTRMNGARVIIGGQGLKAKLYRGETELTIGDKATVNVITAGAPQARQEPAPAGSPSARQPAPAAQKETPAKTLNRFHSTMARTALLLLHARQYAKDIEAKEGGPMTADQFQATVSSLFITGKDKGLIDIVPAPRALVEGKPVKWVPLKDAEDPEAEAKKAEEAARRAAEEEKRRKAQEALDEDVPF